MRIQRLWCLAPAALLAGCSVATKPAPTATVGTAVPTASATTVARFDEGGFSFSYPANWKQAAFGNPSSSASTLLTYLSSQALTNPCVQPARTGPEYCSLCTAVGHLSPRAVILWWTEGSRPWATPYPGQPTTIAGHPATFGVVRPPKLPDCSQVGADETVTTDVLTTPANDYVMTACVRGPDLGRTEAAIRAMLASARLVSP